MGRFYLNNKTYKTKKVKVKDLKDGDRFILLHQIMKWRVDKGKDVVNVIKLTVYVFKGKTIFREIKDVALITDEQFMME